MQNLTVAALTLLLLLPTLAGAQTEVPPAAAKEPSSTITVVGRVGVSRTPYHTLEAWRTDAKGKWIFPDVGYIAFDSPSTYREFFVGFGRTLVADKKFVAVGELYLAQATGPAANGATYLQPWILGIYNFSSKVQFEWVYFLYIPLNETATAQHVLEHAKIERVLGGKFSVGAGYGGYKFGDDPWQHKPFVAGTYSTKNGRSYELWLQRLPHGLQVQARFTGTF